MVNGFNNINIGFLLLCHDNPSKIRELLSFPYFRTENVKVYLHYDANKPVADHQAIQNLCNEFDNVSYVHDNVKCAWGEWSLVEGTLKAMEACLKDETFIAERLFLISGSCRPIKPIANLQSFLVKYPKLEFIEAVNIQEQKWVKDGLEWERFTFYFPYNFMKERRKFDSFLKLQQTVSVRRSVPKDLTIHFGSQWFCLTRGTCETILQELSDPKLIKFFKNSWIPDEFAIQTLVAKNVDKKNIANKNLTYYEFNSFGKPLVFYNDHYDHLISQPAFFARKFSKSAIHLIDKLKQGTSDSGAQKLITINNLAHKGTKLKLHQLKHTSPDKGGKIGRTNDPWKDGIEKNYKKYWILVGCEHLIKTLTNIARIKNDNFIYFDYMFDPFTLNPTGTNEPYLGFGEADIERRDYDHVAFLYQMIHSSEKDVCFAMDPKDSSKLNEILRWNYQANIVIVEPYWDNELQRLISFLPKEQVSELIGEDNNIIPEALHQLIDWDSINYWQNKATEDNHARVDYIDKYDDDVIIMLNNIRKKLSCIDYLPEENLKLITKLNTKKKFQLEDIGKPKIVKKKKKKIKKKEKKKLNKE